MASDIRAKGMMLFEDRCGRYYAMLNDEQLGYVIRLTHQVWAGQLTPDEAVQTASADYQGDRVIALAVWDFADGALKAQKAYKKQVERGGIGGLKRSFLSIGWDEERFDTKVKELKGEGQDEETVAETLKALYQSERKKAKSIDLVTRNYGQTTPRVQAQGTGMMDVDPVTGLMRTR